MASILDAMNVPAFYYFKIYPLKTNDKPGSRLIQPPKKMKINFGFSL